MATFLNIRTTDAGQALLADVHAGNEKLTITHVAFGSGIWEDSEHSVMNMTALKNEVVRVVPSGGKQVEGEAELTCVLTNSILDTGFALTEIGIIAQREDKTEVLYMADAVSPARSTWISSKSEYRVEIPVALRIVCASTSDVEIRVESTSPVTNEDLDNHNAADNAHADIRQELATHTHSWTNITDKPVTFPVEAHSHTSSEVGLGNLPNAKDDSVTSSRSDVLATSKAVKIAYDKGVAALNTANTKAAASHTHTSLQVGLGNLPNAKSDSVTSASNAQLATSKAVKTAYDKGVSALNTANTKAAADHTHTPLQVGLGSLPNAKSDSVTSASSAQLATSKAVKTAYDKGTAALAVANGKMGAPDWANASLMVTTIGLVQQASADGYIHIKTNTSTAVATLDLVASDGTVFFERAIYLDAYSSTGSTVVFPIKQGTYFTFRSNSGVDPKFIPSI